MNDVWGLALGIIFLCLWVGFMSYYGAVRKAYTQGRIDKIRHKNKCSEYKGIALFFYRRGRRAQALRHRIKVHSKMDRGGYGTPNLR